MNRGFLKSIRYYLIGLGLAGLSYLTIGHEYIHAPGAHQLIILLTFFAGFMWLIVTVAVYLTGQRTENVKGIILTNLIMTLGFLVFMIYVIHDATDNYEFETNADIITIEESGDTTTMYQGGSPVYLKVKDSVRFNFIDSVKIDWDKVERRKK